MRKPEVLLELALSPINLSISRQMETEYPFPNRAEISGSCSLNPGAGQGHAVENIVEIEDSKNAENNETKP